MRRLARLPAVTVIPAALLVVLAACASAYRPAGPQSTGGVAASAVSGSVSMVSCSGATCSVTLAGSGSRAQVLGTWISLEGADDRRATLRVGHQIVTCIPGGEVAAGSLRLACTTVSEGTVTFTASPG